MFLRLFLIEMCREFVLCFLLIKWKVPLLISHNYFSLMLLSGSVKHLVLFCYFFLTGTLSVSLFVFIHSLDIKKFYKPKSSFVLSMFMIIFV